MAREPSMAKNSSPSRAPKTGAQLQTTWKSAKNGLIRPKNPLIAAITLHKAAQFALCVPVSVAQLLLKRRDEQNLRHFHCSREQRRCMITGTSTTARTAPAAPPSTCRSQQRACHHLVRELQLWNTTVFFSARLDPSTVCTQRA